MVQTKIIKATNARDWNRGMALQVMAQSPLSRRRARARFLAEGAGPQQRLSLRFWAALALLFLLAIGGQWVAGAQRVPHNRALGITKARSTGFDRFNVHHWVNEDETLSGLAERYYGSPSSKNWRRIQAANPDLPEEQLNEKGKTVIPMSTRIKIKVPVEFIP